MPNNSIIDISSFFSNLVKANFVFSKIDLTPCIVSDLGFHKNEIAIPEQVHSNKVKWINSGGSYKFVDGLITSNNNIVLTLKVADCVPVYFYNLDKNIIGLVHAGWRGIVTEIIPNTIEILKKYGANIDNTYIYMGPSIQRCCYEVGNEVAKLFDEDAKIKINSKKYKIDLKKQISLQLRKLGAPKNNIKVSLICSYESSFCQSYRRDGSSSERMHALIGYK